MGAVALVVCLFVFPQPPVLPADQEKMASCTIPDMEPQNYCQSQPLPSLTRMGLKRKAETPRPTCPWVPGKGLLALRKGTN